MKVALTGGIGSGKSSVARLLHDKGAIIIDADAIAREIVEPGRPALEEIREAFGADVIAEDGSLDRSSLAQMVFSNPAALARLNGITHPRIAERSAELLAQASAEDIIVYDMPLLVEQGTAALAGWDAIVVVDAPDDVRLDRVVTRGLAREDARRRMAAQSSRADRLAIADHVLDNSGTREDLAARVDDLWTRLIGAST
jgi:dephospho-CoA kinase